MAAALTASLLLMAVGSALSVAVVAQADAVWVSASRDGPEAGLALGPSGCTNRGISYNASSGSVVVVPGQPATRECGKLLTTISRRGDGTTGSLNAWNDQSFSLFEASLGLGAAASCVALVSGLVVVFGREQASAGPRQQDAALEPSGGSTAWPRRAARAARAVLHWVAPLTLLPALVAGALWAVAGSVATVANHGACGGAVGAVLGVVVGPGAAMALAASALTFGSAVAMVAATIGGRDFAPGLGALGGWTGVLGGGMLALLLPRTSTGATALSTYLGWSTVALGAVVTVWAMVLGRRARSVTDGAAAPAEPVVGEEPLLAGSAPEPRERLRLLGPALAVPSLASWGMIGLIGCPACFFGVAAFVATGVAVLAACPLGMLGASFVPAVGPALVPTVPVALNAALVTGTAASVRGPLAVLAALVALSPVTLPALYAAKLARGAGVPCTSLDTVAAAAPAAVTAALALVWALGTATERTVIQLGLSCQAL